jgi:hypothetical protein
VKWKGRTQAIGSCSDLPKVTITDSMRCRIAHLAVCPKARRLVNLVYGPKNERQTLDDFNLRVAQLWQEIASEFINASAWQPMSSIEYFNVFNDLDPSQAPPQPGLDVESMKDVWHALRTDFSRLMNALYSPTGASNTAGDQFFKLAWENFINGTKLSFQNKKVTMYVFMLWFAEETQLPQWCRRTLNTKAQLRYGDDGADVPNNFQTPVKAGGGKPDTSPSNPALEKLFTLLQAKWEKPESTPTQPPDVEIARAVRMGSIQTQLNALDVARKVNVGAGKCTTTIDCAIEKLTNKLLDNIE